MKSPSKVAIPGPARSTDPAQADVGMSIDGLVIASVAVGEEVDWPTSLTLTLDATSAGRLAAFTEAHVGVRVQVVVGGEVILTPRISTPIRGGVVVATMGKRSEAMRLADLLRVRSAVLSIRIAH